MGNKTLAAIGEALIDFIPNKNGCEFYDVTAFEPKVGGAPANVCGAFARMGGRARMITQLGNDPFGEKIRRELDLYGIDTSCISHTDKANTALAFVSLGADGNRTFSFYRKPSADMLLTPDAVSDKWFEGAGILHFCSVSLGDFPMRETHKRAIAAAHERDMIVSFDPNLRFNLWDDRDALYRTVNEFIPHADILKISDEELEFIAGTADIAAAKEKLFRGNVKLIVYTCGANGAYAITKNVCVFAPSRKVKAVDTTGAGDGFIGSFLWCLSNDSVTRADLGALSEDTLRRYLAFSAKFCAMSITKSGAVASYPTLDEMLTAAR